MSQLQKDVSICIEQKNLYLLQLPAFLELRYVSLRYDMRQKSELESRTQKLPFCKQPLKY